MTAWYFITRLAEAEILLPAALLVGLLWGWQREGRAPALAWLSGLMLATGLVTASKVAFIGWGVGSARWDFTGISGHSMYAAAIYPVALAVSVRGLLGRGQWLAAAAGAVLALLIGVSRVMVLAHSVSEVVAGLALGASVSVWVLGVARWRGPAWLAGWQWLAPALLMVWLMGSVNWAPPSGTHALVTRLSLRLSGHQRPFTRADLHRQRRAEPSRIEEVLT